MILDIEMRNRNSGKSLRLNQEVGQSYLLEKIVWGTIESARQSYKFLNQIGVFVTGTTLETREVSVIGWVVAEDENMMKDRKKFLNSFCNPFSLIDILYQDYCISGYPQTTISYGEEEAENNEVMCKFMITLFCADPLFKTKDAVKNEIAYWDPLFEFPLEIPEDEGIEFGSRVYSNIYQVANTGDLPCGFVLTAEFVADIWAYFSITLIDTQETLYISNDYGELKAGTKLIISTVANNKFCKLIKSNGEEQNFMNRVRLKDSKFFQLPVGTSSIQYETGFNSKEDAVNVTLEFTPQFLEVQ